MIDKNAHLEELLEAMIAEDETITARAIVRRSGDVFKNATDITRMSTDAPNSRLPNESRRL
ncbi:hypothetical protein [Rhizobium bangladeshense]|uniref:hypothetical protein n=1 Tax=Rhizobium bangladeshense TaxID=1138189 RepID=UPI002180B2F9|nr:hypothetical protein [Rhizobium bangladeshense]